MAVRIALFLLFQFACVALSADQAPLCFVTGRHWIVLVYPDGSGTLREQGWSQYSRHIAKNSFDYASLAAEVERLEKRGKTGGEVVRYYFASYDFFGSTEVNLSPKLRQFFRHAEAELRAQGDQILNALLDRRPLEPGPA